MKGCGIVWERPQAEPSIQNLKVLLKSFISRLGKWGTSTQITVDLHSPEPVQVSISEMFVLEKL